MTYLAVASLGTDRQRAAYRTAVKRQQRLVRSDEHSPVDYNALARELQLWVAACPRSSATSSDWRGPSRTRPASTGSCRRPTGATDVPRALRNFPLNYFLWGFRVRRVLRRPLV